MEIILRKSLALLLIACLGMASATSAVAWQCVDYDSVENTPSFSNPSKTRWRKFWNYFLPHHQPFHMVHDVVSAQGQSFTVVGKFDYGAIAHKDLEYEYIAVYYTGTGMNHWQYKGQYKTNSDGKIYVNFSSLPVGNYRVRMVVRGDLSRADGWVSVVEPGTQAVIFDIDGTLTKSDFEQIGDYTGIDEADPRPSASALVNAYRNLGYQPVFLTARVYWYAKGSRRWLGNQGMPEWTLKTSFDNGTSLFNTANYKRDYINLLQNNGVSVVRAYGNASTDIEGFINAGIPLSDIWIIGENAGNSGTQGIYDAGFTDHINQIVNVTAPSNCQ